MTRKAPKIIEVTSQRFEELLQRAESNTLRDDDMELMRQIFASYSGFFQIVGDKNTTITRLRKLMFGATTEKSKDVLGDTETGCRSTAFRGCRGVAKFRSRPRHSGTLSTPRLC